MDCKVGKKTDGFFEDDISNRELNEDEMNRLMRQVSHENTKGIVIGLLIVTLGILISVWGDLKYDSFLIELLGIFVVMIGGIVSVILCWFGKALDLDEIIKKNLIPAALKEIFDDYTYEPYESIDPEVIRSTQMKFPYEKIEDISGGDHVKASYKGIPFEACDLDITYEDTFQKPAYRTVTVFSGTWFIINHGIGLNEDVFLSENEKLKAPKKNMAYTQNDLFNRKYKIYAENTEDAKRVFSDQMMETIMKLNEKADGKIYLCFQKNGKLHIAIYSYHNMFEFHCSGKQTFAELKKQFKDEIKYITDLIEEMKNMR